MREILGKMMFPKTLWKLPQVRLYLKIVEPLTVRMVPKSLTRKLLEIPLTMSSRMFPKTRELSQKMVLQYPKMRETLSLTMKMLPRSLTRKLLEIRVYLKMREPLTMSLRMFPKTRKLPQKMVENVSKNEGVITKDGVTVSEDEGDTVTDDEDATKESDKEVAGNKGVSKDERATDNELENVSKNEGVITKDGVTVSEDEGDTVTDDED
jgi:hypothetical protein